MGNAIMQKRPEATINKLRKAVLDEVEEAITEAGRVADLLATKADFTEDPVEQINLLKEALVLAVAEGDHDNVFIIFDSMCDAFDTLEDQNSISGVLEQCRTYAATHKQLDNTFFADVENRFRKTIG